MDCEMISVDQKNNNDDDDKPSPELEPWSQVDEFQEETGLGFCRIYFKEESHDSSDPEEHAEEPESVKCRENTSASDIAGHEVGGGVDKQDPEGHQITSGSPENCMVSEKKLFFDLRHSPYGCSHCSYTSTSLVMLRNHVSQKHLSGISNSCKFCDYKNSDQVEFQVHLNSHEHYTCVDCGFQCINASFLKTHCKVHDYRKGISGTSNKCENTSEHNALYGCGYCNFSAYNLGYLKAHVARHLKCNLKNYCNFCTFKSSDEIELKRHINSHNNYRCVTCGYKCSNADDLKTNCESHPQEDIFQSYILKNNFVNLVKKSYRNKNMHTTKIKSDFLKVEAENEVGSDSTDGFKVDAKNVKVESDTTSTECTEETSILKFECSAIDNTEPNVGAGVGIHKKKGDSTITSNNEKTVNPGQKECIIKEQAQFGCTHCEFLSNDVAPLKKHLGNHHPGGNLCKFCDFESSDKFKLQLHLNSHKNNMGVSCRLKCNNHIYLETHNPNEKGNLCNPQKMKTSVVHGQNSIASESSKKLKNVGVQCSIITNKKYDRIVKKSISLGMNEVNEKSDTTFTNSKKNSYAIDNAANYISPLVDEIGKTISITPKTCETSITPESDAKSNVFKLPYACSDCNFSSYNLGPLKWHVDTVHLKKVYGCVHCTYKSHKLGNLKRHVGKHNIGRQLRNICNFCDFVCTEKSKLRAHVNSHSNFKCVLCGFQSSNEMQLKTHYQNHEGLNEKDTSVSPVKCENSYIPGQNTNTREPQSLYGCAYCHFSSFDTAPLKTHVFKLHVRGNCGNSCNICDFKCSDELELEDHLNLHNNYRCLTCGYKCCDADNLKTHHLSHLTMNVNLSGSLKKDSENSGKTSSIEGKNSEPDCLKFDAESVYKKPKLRFTYSKKNISANNRAGHDTSAAPNKIENEEGHAVSSIKCETSITSVPIENRQLRTYCKTRTAENRFISGTVKNKIENVREELATKSSEKKSAERAEMRENTAAEIIEGTSAESNENTSAEFTENTSAERKERASPLIREIASAESRKKTSAERTDKTYALDSARQEVGVTVDEQDEKDSMITSNCEKSVVPRQSILIEQAPYECDQCKFSTCNPAHFEKHVEMRNCICEMCGFQCCNAIYLESHCKKHNTLSKEGNTVTSKNEKSFVAIQTEIPCNSFKVANTREPPTLLGCGHCNFSTYDAAPLKAHVFRVHLLQCSGNTCKFCYFKCSDELQLKAHLSSHNNYRCVTCGNKFRDTNDLKTHSETHPSNTTFQSGSLNNSLENVGQKPSRGTNAWGKNSRSDTLKMDVESVKEKPNFRFTYSKKDPYVANTASPDISYEKGKYEGHSVTPRSFETFITSVQNENDLKTQSRYGCTHCDYSSHNLGHLRNHVVIVHIEKNLGNICHFCDNVYSDRFSLKVHLNAHNNYKCLICGFQCSNVYYLRTHCSNMHQAEIGSQPELENSGKRSQAHTKTSDRNTLRCNNTLPNERLFRKRLNVVEESDLALADCIKETKRSIEQANKQGKREGQSIIAGNYESASDPNRKTVRRSYGCAHCSYSSNSIDSLENHVNIHLGGHLENICKFCNYKSSDRLRLIVHLNSHNNYRCLICRYECCDVYQLKSHCQTHAVEGTTGSNSLTMEFENLGEKPDLPSATDLAQYDAVFEEKGKNEGHSVTSAKCKKSITSVQNGNTRKFLYGCAHCKFSSNHLGPLKTHLFHVHLGENCGSRCYFCDYKSVDQTKLQVHLNSHKHFICGDCGFQCCNTHHLKFHCKIHSAERSSKSKLESVGKKSFRSRQACDKNSFLCEVCGDEFITSWQLERHRIIHSGKNNLHLCKFCNLMFKNSSHLKVHLKKHVAEKCYNCKFCNYKSFSSFLLKMHRRNHKRVKHFNCEFCDVKFYKKYTFNAHMLRYHANKIFRCNLCDYKCQSRRAFKKHSLTHTADERFNCESCDYKSTDVENLRIHLESHSNDEHFDHTYSKPL